MSVFFLCAGNYGCRWSPDGTLAFDGSDDLSRKNPFREVLFSSVVDLSAATSFLISRRNCISLVSVSCVTYLSLINNNNVGVLDGSKHKSESRISLRWPGKKWREFFQRCWQVGRNAMSIIVIVRDGRERCPGFHSVPKVLQVEIFVYKLFFYWWVRI